MKFQLKGDYFDGQWHLSEDVPEKNIFKKECPANLNDILYVCPTDQKHVWPLLESLQRGYKKWRLTSIEERKEYLLKFKENVLKRKEELVRAIALETGKPLWEAETEVAGVIGKVDVTLIDSFKRIETKKFNSIAPNTNGLVKFRPIGPSLIIGPFNFPCHLPNTQILASLLAGNSIAFKPSEKTIYSGQLLFECLEKANFPKGVINFINGSGDIVSRILKEKIVKGIYFTGSREIGKKIIGLTYKNLDKLVALELGGKNTSIVHSDANQDMAMTELIKASFMTTGQRCVSTSKVAIHESLAQSFIGKFHQIAKKLVIDHPIDYDKEPFMGPLIDRKSVDNYLNFMGIAVREGATEIMRGKQLEKKFPGHYVSPSIHFIEKADPTSHFQKDELFGPNISFIPYREIEEAIEISNMTDYGLAGSLFSSDQGLFEKCLQEIDVGVFNLNRSTCGASSKLPFGGVKQSGNFRPAAISMIDACVHPVSCLELTGDVDYSLKSIKGLD